MAVRGIVVAIEEYPDATDIGRRLEGTHASGLRFVEWLTTVKGARREDVLFCAGAATGADVGTTKKAILDELQDRLPAWRDTTEELYVFWSGHGFAISDGPAALPADVLVTSEFESLARSGDACLRLAALQDALSRALGSGHHFWFIDACRNLIEEDVVDAGNLSRRFGQSKLGWSRCRSVLQAVPSESAARVQSAYVDSLLAGLRGRGRAKGWTARNALVVSFGRLADAMRDLGAEAEERGSCDRTIIELAAPYAVPCAVEVRGASETDAWILVAAAVGSAPMADIAFNGARHALSLPPNDYVLELRPSPGAPRDVAVMRQHADLWDGGTVVFDPASPSLTSVPLGSPTFESLPLRSLPTASQSKAIDASRAAFLASIGQTPRSDEYHLSETLGPMRESSLGLWLTLLGASRLAGDRWYSKLGQAPFDIAPAPGRIVVLAHASAGQRVSLASACDEGAPALRDATEVLPGIWQATIDMPIDEAPGAAPLLLWRIGDQRARATRTLANCDGTTLVVLDRDEGELALWQFLIPLPHIANAMNFWDGAPALRPMRLAWEVQRDFARGRWSADARAGRAPEEQAWLPRGEPLTALLDLYASDDAPPMLSPAQWAESELVADLDLVAPERRRLRSSAWVPGWPSVPIVREGLWRSERAAAPTRWLSRVDPRVVWSTWFVKEPRR